MPNIRDILTPQWLRETFVVGVDLTLDDGTPFPDAMYAQYINNAITYVQHEFGLIIDALTITGERHDAYWDASSAWWPFSLDNRPIISLDKWFIHYGEFPAVEMPISWLQVLSAQHGQLRTVPSAETLGSFLFSRGIPLLAQGGFSSFVNWIPNYFEFNYTAGFLILDGTVSFAIGETEKTITFDPKIEPPVYEVTTTAVGGSSGDKAIIESVVSKKRNQFTIKLASAPGAQLDVYWLLDSLSPDLKQCIGLKAATGALNIAGELILGAGIASKSNGLDGISQSVNSTASAENAGYGARVRQNERELKDLLPALRSKYKIPGFFCI